MIKTVGEIKEVLQNIPNKTEIKVLNRNEYGDFVGCFIDKIIEEPHLIIIYPKELKNEN